MTHTTEPWHNSPLPEGVSHAVTVPPGRGGGRSGGPSGQTWTGTQDGDLQSGTDNGGHGGAGSSGGHGGAGSSGDHGGAGSSGDHGGAGSSGDHGSAGSSGSHGRWSSWPCPSARPLQPGTLGSWGFFWAWHQGPSQGPSATASTTRGAACPRRVSVDKTRQDLIKMFLWAQQDTNTALLAVTCGLDPQS